MGIGQAREVTLVQDRGREARLGKDHHTGRRLDQVRAGARADDQKEGVLHLAVQPDDAGQAAEHFALAALHQHRGLSTADVGMDRDDRAHDAAPTAGSLALWSSRAARSFNRN